MMRYLAAMLWFKADESHDTHVHDGREVVEDGDYGENKQLVASIGAEQCQRLVEIHRQSKRHIFISTLEMVWSRPITACAELRYLLYTVSHKQRATRRSLVKCGIEE